MRTPPQRNGGPRIAGLPPNGALFAYLQRIANFLKKTFVTW